MATFSDTGDTLRNLLGAALMGVGGVMALGCTVGQAITGVSTLALGSFLSFAAIARALSELWPLLAVSYLVFAFGERKGGAAEAPRGHHI